MKTCTVCQVEKPNSSFHKHKTSKDGLFPYCIVCRREKGKYDPAKRSISNQKTRDELYGKVMRYLLEHPCVDCGETNLLTLEFDHRDGAESRNHRVMTLVTGRSSWDRILEEIEKCDVRCANCHKIVTYRRSNSWRYRYVTENFPGDGEGKRVAEQ